MQLRMATDYAIRSVLYLALNGGVCTAQEIGDRMGITHNYTQQILRKLRTSGIVVANVGNSGGYALNKPPEDISLYDIMVLFENSMKINACLEEGHECSRKDKTAACSVRLFYEQFQSIIDKTTIATTMRDLIDMKAGEKLRRRFEAAEKSAEKTDAEEYINHEKTVNEGLQLALSMGHPEESLEVLVRYIGEKMSADRSYIFEFREDGDADNTYEWCREGVTPEKDNLQEIPGSVLKQWMKRFVNNRCIIIKDIEDIRESDNECYKSLQIQDIRSLVAAPLIDGDKVIGFFGVDNPRKENFNNAATLLEIVGKFFTSIIRRRDLVRRLEKFGSRDELTGLLNRENGEKYIKSRMLQKSTGALLIVNLDDFRKINDNYDHMIGDLVLEEAGSRIRNLCRQI